MAQRTTSAVQTATTIRPTSLYRYYDEWGILIYVGITSRGGRRNIEHNMTKDWWVYVTRQEVEHYDTWDDAHLAEVAAIEHFTPPFNSNHNKSSSEMKAAYLGMRTELERNAASDDPSLVRTRQGHLPLFISGTPDCTRFWFPTSTAGITACIETNKQQVKVVAQTGIRVGHSVAFQRRGAFLAIDAVVRKNLDIQSAFAKVRRIPEPPYGRVRVERIKVHCNGDLSASRSRTASAR